ncbi:pyridoxal-phosphate-dependent aminotransferase family protein [Zwartia sp.]|uniref:pyridoxal-phosphate-dependent aminotransferase family protein n=1 Tax=Zwartia sp. TaxID=2978004 RepID=UPI003BAEA2D0
MTSSAAAFPYFPGVRLLHSPGPSNVPKAVLDAMTKQPMDMGDPRVDACVDACESGLKKLLKTQAADVFFYAANGHGAWEAMIVNLLAPGQKVLIPGTGHFSESWAIMAEAMGAIVVRTPFHEGYPIDPDAVAQILRADTQHEIVAVFTVHTDTASSTTSDIPALRRAIDATGHPALFVVDVVASLGAIPFDMDQWGVNAVIGASQKGLMVPPGVGFCVADARAMQVCEKNPAPRFYWDWLRRRKGPSYSRFCGTAPQNLLFGMEAAFELLAREGVETVYARHRALAGAVRAAVQSWSQAGNLDFLCKVPSARSDSVTAIVVKPGIDPELIRKTAREKFQVMVAGGLGPFAGRVFRIGHLGDLNPAMILGCIAGVEAAMQSLGIEVGDRGVRSAVEYLSKDAG